MNTACSEQPTIEVENKKSDWPQEFDKDSLLIFFLIQHQIKRNLFF